MNSNLNRGQWKQLENSWADAIKAGKRVEVEILSVFSGTSKRPIGFSVVYKIDGQPFRRTFKNE